MVVGLDTSVLIRLLIGLPPGQASTALEFVKKARIAGRHVIISDLVISEAYFALQLEAAARCSSKPGFVDRLIHAQYERFPASMATFERAAGRLPVTTVLR